MMKGIITEVQGPVVDVLFPEGQLPFIKDALTVQNGEQKCVMEVAQHMGGNVVRCIMLSPSEGLCREMEVIAEGGGIRVPVGDRTLGRLFNVTGDVIDAPSTARARRTRCPTGPSTAKPPALPSRNPPLRFWRPASRSSTCWPPTPRAVRSVCSAAQASAKRYSSRS